MRKPSEQADRAAESPLEDADVLDYLAAHPDFLARHPELLSGLLPERRSGDKVIDLQRFLVERVRRRTEALQEERERLIALARLNTKSQARVHRAVLALMGAASFEHLVQAATVDLPVFLGLDAAILGIEGTESPATAGEIAGVRLLEPDSVDQLIGRERDMLLRGDGEAARELFGPVAPLIRSQALLRLRISSIVPPALLALGSRKSKRFHPGQGTELLAFLARALESSIRGWLDLPR